MYAPKCVTPDVSAWSHRLDPASASHDILHHVSCVMCHVSCVMCHVSCVMCHVLCVMCVMCNLTFCFMCHASCVMRHVSFVICHLSCVICYVSYVMCHVSYLFIFHFVSFDISCHLTFCVISHFVSLDISCDLSDLSHYCNHSHKSHHSIYVQVVVEDRCVLKKWVRAYSHRAVSRIELLRS